MKKIVKSLSLIIITIIIASCSNERELIDEVSTSNQQPEDIIYSLPKNAVHIDDVLKNNGIVPKSKVIENSSRRLSDGVINTGDEDNEVTFSGYLRIFVVFPTEWTQADRIGYFSRVRAVTPHIFMVQDSCDDVDTWYFPQNAFVPEKDKNKNIIVATTEEVSDEDEEDEEDGPKGERIVYNSCQEVELDFN
ncbi:conserved hypothetical protein [Tenacibaculum sp. 190524A05c]|uniref:hypothetical protein n=1 Tax=Tenacibaculum platacis TaxID=3137852 RepID=UPI0031FA72D3